MNPPNYKIISEGLFLLIAGFTLVVIVSILLGLPTMWAWNYVMPYLFGLKEITFLHGIALNFLSGSLIKSSLTNKK